MKKTKQDMGGYGGCLLIIIAAVVLMWMASCTKQVVGEKTYTFDKYELVIYHYSLDTSKVLQSFVWWQDDSIWKAETKQMLDTIPDGWYYMCPTTERPDGWVEQHYYTKNGKKIQPSTYPKIIF